MPMQVKSEDREVEPVAGGGEVSIEDRGTAPDHADVQSVGTYMGVSHGDSMKQDVKHEEGDQPLGTEEDKAGGSDEYEEDEEEESDDDAEFDEAIAQEKRKSPVENAENLDYRLARKLQQEFAGIDRPKRGAACAQYTEFDEEFVDDDIGRAPGGYSGDASRSNHKTKLKLKISKPEGWSLTSMASRSEVTGTSFSEQDIDDDDLDDEEALRQAELAKRRKMIAPVLLSDEELVKLDDEVEMVITHRERENLQEGTYDKVPLSGQQAWSNREFYVKWARCSHIHNSWDSYQTLSLLGGFKRVLNYCKKVDAANARRVHLTVEEKEEADIRASLELEIEKEHGQVERVFGERLKEVDGREGNIRPSTQYLCKWKGLPYADATWENKEELEKINATDAIVAYSTRERLAQEPRQTVDAARKNFSSSGHRALDTQPEYLQQGQLRDYQLEGLNWMVYNWARGVNGILADEMGLGKTIQCASIVGYLSQVQHIGAPIIIVVPLSTVPNWAKEFAKWIPSVNTIVYVGNSSSREVIRHFEFPLPTPVPGRKSKFDALITTFEMVLKDSSILRDIKWASLIVDEAHRLKNSESALYKELSQWNFKSKLLVTGTPLQNNIKELWSLLHFLHPSKFPSCEAFETAHDLGDPAGVERLHAVLRPHLLRRVIKDVEKSLPPKRERILRVPMTPLQKQYYKWILTRNFKQLNKNAKGAQITLLNIIVDLKKCCNHPFLFESARENYQASSGSSEDFVTNLVVTSGKMVLLDKLLKRLKETGHRVLIFSQMVRVLDIISEYMSRKGYKHQRLDGSTPAQKRHQAMERFNASESQDFAFLLSTRAGGLGINLATADTVLLFDSDWNPQNDLQAMARAHRIGQKDAVNIYRLVTGGSVEEDIIERAKNKMVLDHLVIQRMDTSGRTVLGSGPGSAAAGVKMFNKEELAAILKFGAEDLFGEDETKGSGGQAASTAMTDEDLDAILARAEEIDHQEHRNEGASDLLSSFNVATFKSDEDDASFWSRLIPEDMRPTEQQVIQQDPGIRAARLKAMDLKGERNLESSRTQNIGKKEKKKAMKDMPGPPIEGAEIRMDRWPQAVDKEGRLVADESSPRPQNFPHTMSKREASGFIKAFKRFPLISRLDDLARLAGGKLVQIDKNATESLWYGLLRGCEKAVDNLTRKIGASGGAEVMLGHNGSRTKGPEAHLDFFGVDVKAVDILALVRQMGILDSKLAEGRHLQLGEQERPPPTAWMRACGWTPQDDAALLVGCHKHGIGDWSKIYEDEALGLSEKIWPALNPHASASDLPKASHLETRAFSLLRQLEKSYLGLKRKREGGELSRNKNTRDPNQKFEKALGKETLTIIRKLRTLQRKGAQMEPSLVVSKTRKYMEVIGEKIDSIALTSKKKEMFWDYVSRFTENSMSAGKLRQVYDKLIQEKKSKESAS